MLGTFLYLTSCSIKNRLRTRLRRLREPRYLIGLIVGAAYLYYFVFARGFSGSTPSGKTNRSIVTMLNEHATEVQFLGGLFLLLSAALMWLWPGSRKPMEFSRAEVQFFFQAPIARRQLLHYKLLRSQIGLLFGTAIATVFLRPATLLAGWTMFAGIWLVLTVARLHSIGVSFSRESLARHGKSGLARQWLPLAVLVGVFASLAASVATDWPALVALPSAGVVIAELQRIWSTGAPAVVLWPFMTLAKLPVAASPSAFTAALPAALALIVINYAWVLRADTAFEEASAAQAEKKAEARVAPRRARIRSMSTPFTLAIQGRAETAVMWKNLILIGRYASLKTLISIVPMLIVFGIIGARGGGRGGLAEVLAIVCMVGTGIAALIGPQIARNDLRQDLTNLSLIKMWPIRGATLVRGELLAPTVVLSVFAWLFIISGAILLGISPTRSETGLTILANRFSYAAAAMIAVPPVMVIQLVVQNGIAVLFPAWITLGSSRARGIDAMGQRLLMTFGSLIALVVLLLPAALVAGFAGVAIYFATDTIVVVLPALVVALVVAAEVFLATEWLGRVLDRTDVTSIDASS